MIRAGRTGLALLAGAALLVAGLGAAAEDEPVRAITQVAGDLYRFQNNNHYSVFLVTPAGIIATDPINRDAATWLKGELDSRFAKPVKYLIYSHDHADHISGGEVFADTATVIAHERALPHILGEKRATAVPDLTFSERMTISLGGKTVELTAVGYSHSDNLIVMRFPDERALFAVDIVAVNRVPYRDFPMAFIDHWIAGLKMIEGMDFEILVPGHGPVGTRADAAAHRGYIEDLRGQVLALMRAGKSLDEIRTAVDLSAYKDWSQYEAWSPLNIDGMYRYLVQYRGGT